MKQLHKQLFNDIYDWAGQERDVIIAKSNCFCLPQYINSMASDIFGKLKRDSNLLGMNKNILIPKLAYYMSEVNALHPFREGNGRTQRLFFIKLLNQAGYNLDFSKVGAKELLNADISAMSDSDKALQVLLEIMVDKKSSEKSIGTRIEDAKNKSEQLRGVHETRNIRQINDER